MSEQKYRVVFKGEIKEGADLETVQKKLSLIFKSDIEKIKSLFSGDETIIKKNASLEVCEKMKLAFIKAGTDCKIEEIDSNPIEDNPSTKTISSKSRDHEKPSVNPYDAPQANLETMDHDMKKGFTGPQKVPAGNGAKWIFRGYSLFRKNPFAWFFTIVIYFLIAGIVQIIPILGPIVFNLFNPVFAAGFIHGAREQSLGGNFKIGHLFSGFSNNFGQLILFSLLYLGLTLVIIVVPVGLIFGSMIGFGMLNLSDPSSLANTSSIIMMIMVFLIIILLMIPLMMAYWFSPALISVNKIPVIEAVKMSFKGCMSNMLPFTTYGLVSLGIVAVLMLIMGMLITGITEFGTTVIIIASILFGSGMIVIIPTFMASIYASYEDIYYKK